MYLRKWRVSYRNTFTEKADWNFDVVVVGCLLGGVQARQMRHWCELPKASKLSKKHTQITTSFYTPYN